MKLLAALTMLLSFNVFSTDVSNLSLDLMQTEDHHGKKFCRKAKITEAQKLEMKAIMQGSRGRAQELRAQVQAAALELKTTYKDPNTTSVTANVATQELFNKMRPLVDLKMGNLNKVLFDVLEFEQRRPFMKCLKKAHERQRRRDDRRRRP
jgi:Spy/CpxP family protein refolding chaperone